MARPGVWAAVWAEVRAEYVAEGKGACDKEHCGQCPGEQNCAAENQKRTQEVKRPYLRSNPNVVQNGRGETVPQGGRAASPRRMSRTEEPGQLDVKSPGPFTSLRPGLHQIFSAAVRKLATRGRGRKLRM